MIAIPKEEPIVIEIENKEIANSFKAYFEDFWKKTKKNYLSGTKVNAFSNAILP